jgi:outer membrane lipoprotein SlyB
MTQVIRTTPRLHPLFAAAAISVIAVSAAGVGVLTGMLPGSHAGAVSTTANLPAAARLASQAAPAAVIPAPVAAPEVAAQQPIPKPAAKPRAVKVAAAEHAYNDAAPVRPGTLPAVGSAAQRNDPFESNPYGVPGNGYGNAPVQVTQVPVAKPVCANCGVVEAVIETTRPGEGSGIGIAGGALGGAVVGKQFGKGHGQDLLAVLGAVGGAIAGNQIEKSVRATKVYEVRVRMEDGSVKSVNQTTAPTWRNGDHVKVDGGSISLNS